MNLGGKETEVTARRPSRTRVVKCLGAGAVVALLAGALPAVAGATDYCVDISCGGKDAQSLEEAIGLADDDGEADRIFLGAEKYTAQTPNGFNYSAADTVEIIGQGIGQTILTGPPGAFSVLSLFGGRTPRSRT
jgi:hypothetical protein